MAAPPLVFEICVSPYTSIYREFPTYQYRISLKASGATDIAGGPQQDIQITPLYATPGSGIDQSVEFDVVGLQPWPDVLVQFQVFTYGMGIGVLTAFPLSEVE